MILKEIQQKFHQELDAIFGSEEVESFFFLVLDHYLNKRRIDLALNPELEVSIEENQKFEDVLERLKLEEPIQYILGETEFYGLTFQVNKHTLIPRPETEELVNWIQEDLKNRKDPLKILDIGTGSGCIPVSLAKNFTNAEVFALDISQEALEVAQKNAQNNSAKVHFLRGDILNYESLLQDGRLIREFDVIVSNPPYVRNLEKYEIKNNVLEFEPHLALFVEDDDPLVFYRKIAQFAVENLKEGGSLYFEINQYLGEEMESLMTQFQFHEIELKQDMFGNQRMIKGLK
ncbi:peptide chain release factor N(5)-glutamine methyltransferase [Mangrovimonas sp. AS39]|uniref:peptide chain release factor N(5)-glutamine methyltransferase n=1 Tax=Mangrovimonas futianensis TaxID=2895523 RepID=UPI001E337D08|nr:peptide chain release factor N(5)-glutamine methyltransferase [Mangrovimonas futianensis]MCF1192625.1 peptide chain release factor N(5)-glutamine methyltransferase [Mangrovimonas futianensis]MCF1196454.1 peptide chain release factor N(5)-glutamine methyltransferase [Mangrovimonas futianensis]